MGRDWNRLGAAFRRHRENQGLTQADIAKATDQNLSTIQNLESARYGKGFNRVPNSAHRVARFLGWSESSIADVLAGGEPTVEEQVEHEAGDRLFADPRADAIWHLNLPVEEREQGIRDLWEADLARAKRQEGDSYRSGSGRTGR